MSARVRLGVHSGARARNAGDPKEDGHSGTAGFRSTGRRNIFPQQYTFGMHSRHFLF